MAEESQEVHPLEALLLRGWGWKQEPPIVSPSGLARRLHISPTTMTKWFSGQTKPETATLMTVAATTGISYKRLAEAAGYPTSPDPDDVLNELLRALDERTDFDEDERAKVRELIEDLRGREGRDRAPREVLPAADAVAC